MDDFKHLLPRLLELVVQGYFSIYRNPGLGKLEQSRWLEWNKKEIEAVRSFVLAWWDPHLR